MNAGAQDAVFWDWERIWKNCKRSRACADPHARFAFSYYQPVSSRVLVAEFVAQMGPLSVVVAYDPTNQSSAEDREHFYSDLDKGKDQN